MAGIGICRWKCEAWPWIQGAREVQAPALPPQKRQCRRGSQAPILFSFSFLSHRSALIWMDRAQQQVRGVYIDCKGLNFEQAMARYGRKMRQDKTLTDLLKKEYYVKPSEQRRQAEKERVKRTKKRLFLEKLKFVLMLRARGL
ncbi:uncharacterized protein LOC112340962 [Selaginella moellendorffii]|uniref:uncharacterized protein LOC112340962 n=1 Tax=Selaginella moellendorffii TaxID=88036 RepID=UPI000D1D074F|nr:uncharacterized protein LOC112340962 [Selaginella moellendorffii]|eukprot:XP_024516020.1 uncharacterized protein LOC112340962 [Selaginella moellendorffii]